MGAFLTWNPETLSLRLSNPFWTQVLERWKAIQPNLYTNPINLIHTSICNSTATNLIIHIPPQPKPNLNPNLNPNPNPNPNPYPNPNPNSNPNPNPNPNPKPTPNPNPNPNQIQIKI